MGPCLSVLLISSELWVLATVNQLFAFTFMKSDVLVVLGFLGRADLELTGEQSLSRLQVTPALERSTPGGRSRETPNLRAFDASAAACCRSDSFSLTERVCGCQLHWPRWLCSEVLGHLLFQVTY